jgi:hypothetical protein
MIRHGSAQAARKRDARDFVVSNLADLLFGNVDSASVDFAMLCCPAAGGATRTVREVSRPL